MCSGDHYEVVILGGGPAGCSAAIALARAGLHVAVLESGWYDRPHFGETFPGAIVRPLAKLNVWESFLAAGHETAPAIASVWGEEDVRENSSISDAYGPGWHVDRQRFDCMLVDAAKNAGAVISCGTRIQSCTQESGQRWRLRVRTLGSILELSADLLVDATGRSSWLARHLGVRRRVFDRLIGIIRFGTACGQAGTAVESSPDGWWYGASLPGGRTVTAFFTDSDLIAREPMQRARSWSAGLSRTRRVSGILSAVDEGGPVYVASASTAKLDCTAGTGWLAMGDAAYSIDPLSGQGLMLALNAGLEAARVISEHRAGDPQAFKTYDARATRAFQHFKVQQTQSYSRESRWPDSSFWRRRIDGGQLPSGFFGQASR
jgi:flavin-dependent dehydrogenase